MKIAVIGAGVSGLSFAKYSKSIGLDATVFEKDSEIGGIAKVEEVGGIPFHLVGGHCFNTKFAEVKKFVFQQVLPEVKWNVIERRASIIFKGQRIPYPIEYSIKEIAQFDESLALQIVKDYFSCERGDAKNLSLWFKKNFGDTLANEYFIPYNRKIWGLDPSSMSAGWVLDKLPIPNDIEFLKGLYGSGRDSMPHSTFYYPKSGTQNEFLSALSEGLNIRVNADIKLVKKTKSGKFEIGGEYYDFIVYTAPLNEICDVVHGCSDEMAKLVQMLKFNSVTTMLWKSANTKDTWTYIPENDIIFHRMIHIGNFVRSAQNYTITEAVGVVPKVDMIRNGKLLSGLVEPIDYNVSRHAYVVFDKSVNIVKKGIKDRLAGSNIFLLGRFGEWEYYNMDVCIKRAMELSKSLN